MTFQMIILHCACAVVAIPYKYNLIVHLITCSGVPLVSTVCMYMYTTCMYMYSTCMYMYSTCTYMYATCVGAEYVTDYHLKSTATYMYMYVLCVHARL